jgi:hypothetical protein
MPRINLSTYTLGRILLALALIAMGIMIHFNGDNYYNKYYHAVRKMQYPDSMGSHLAFGTSLTWDQLITYLIKLDAGLFIMSGVFIFGNQRGAGALTLFLAVSLVLATKDNPFLQSNLKSI